VIHFLIFVDFKNDFFKVFDLFCTIIERLELKQLNLEILERSIINQGLKVENS